MSGRRVDKCYILFCFVFPFCINFSNLNNEIKQKKRVICGKESKKSPKYARFFSYVFLSIQNHPFCWVSLHQIISWLWQYFHAVLLWIATIFLHGLMILILTYSLCHVSVAGWTSSVCQGRARPQGSPDYWHHLARRSPVSVGDTRQNGRHSQDRPGDVGGPPQCLQPRVLGRRHVRRLHAFPQGSCCTRPRWLLFFPLELDSNFYIGYSM